MSLQSISTAKEIYSIIRKALRMTMRTDGRNAFFPNPRTQQPTTQTCQSPREPKKTRLLLSKLVTRLFCGLRILNDSPVQAFRHQRRTTQ